MEHHSAGKRSPSAGKPSAPVEPGGVGNPASEGKTKQHVAEEV